MPEVLDDRIASLLLAEEIRDFLHLEAELLDERRFAEWLDLLSEDIRYWMPITRNVRHDGAALERTRERQDTAWFDEGKETLRQRVAQIATGMHWAEEPRSRTTHMLSNIRIVSATPDARAAEEVEVRSRFLLYRNRVHDETDFFVGKRHDRLRRVEGQWKVARREILLDQTVLLAKNLTSFF